MGSHEGTRRCRVIVIRVTGLPCFAGLRDQSALQNSGTLDREGSERSRRRWTGRRRAQS